MIGLSKHLYRLTGGGIRYQKKGLDPRIPGKEILTRFVLLDVDTGAFYGELHGDDTKDDLAGFLTRAWARKADHFMHGLPEILNIPSMARKNQSYFNDIEFVAKHGGIVLGELPSGFSAGIHAVRLFENQVEQYLDYPDSGKRIPLEFIQSCSAAISNNASISAFMWRETWDKVPDPPASFADAINRLYKHPNGWKEAPFDLVIDGLKVE